MDTHMSAPESRDYLLSTYAIQPSLFWSVKSILPETPSNWKSKMVWHMWPISTAGSRCGRQSKSAAGRGQESDSRKVRHHAKKGACMPIWNNGMT